MKTLRITSLFRCCNFLLGSNSAHNPRHTTPAPDPGKIFPMDSPLGLRDPKGSFGSAKSGSCGS